MSPGNGCEEFMTDWSVVCADRKLTARHRRDVGLQINKLCINISSSRPGMCYQAVEYSWAVLSFFFSLSLSLSPPVFVKALCSCNSFHLMTLLGLQRVTTNWLPGRARMERRETQADSHVIIICLMMCGGGTRREEYWNKSTRDTKEKAFYCGALKDAASFFLWKQCWKHHPLLSINSEDILHPGCL